MGFLKSPQCQELTTSVTFDSSHHVFRETVLQTALKAKSWMLSLESYPTLCDPMDYSPPGSLCSWDSPDMNTGVGYHALLQGIFPIQGSNPHLLHWQTGSLLLVPPGKPGGSEYLEGTRSRIFTQNPSVMTWHLFLQQVSFLKVQSCQVLTAQITVFNKKGGYNLMRSLKKSFPLNFYYEVDFLILNCLPDYNHNLITLKFSPKF